ncbi:MAG: DUF971 domain-containing protein [Ignavibacteria bacterium]|nr:DUF971 domain-containing protein [Ignavibacteria bacterium]
MNISPVKINIKDSRYLCINWDDGSESMLQLANLRKSCPCASCVAEKLNKPATYIPLLASAQLTIKDIKMVGNYAIQLVWQDEHDTGIYTFDKLKEGEY